MVLERTNFRTPSNGNVGYRLGRRVRLIVLGELGVEHGHDGCLTDTGGKEDERGSGRGIGGSIVEITEWRGDVDDRAFLIIFVKDITHPKNKLALVRKSRRGNDVPSRVEGNFGIRKCGYRNSIFPLDRDSEVLSIRSVRQ